MSGLGQLAKPIPSYPASVALLPHIAVHPFGVWLKVLANGVFHLEGSCGMRKRPFWAFVNGTLRDFSSRNPSLMMFYYVLLHIYIYIYIWVNYISPTWIQAILGIIPLTNYDYSEVAVRSLLFTHIYIYIPLFTNLVNKLRPHLAPTIFWALSENPNLQQVGFQTSIQTRMAGWWLVGKSIALRCLTLR